MTTYNTGNPTGSKDPKDLYDNAENFDVAMNNRTADFWTDRRGVQRQTWAGIERSGGIQGFATFTDLYSNVGSALGQLAYVTNDPDKNKNGLYRWVNDAPYWIKSDLVEEEELVLDSLLVNKDVRYPYKATVQNGVLSPTPCYIRESILDVKILGPIEDIEGHYFKISYFGNGYFDGSQEVWGYRVEQYLAEGFEASATRIAIVQDMYDPVQQNYNRASGGIQTVVFSCANNPEITVSMTIDVDSMPPEGELLRMVSNGRAGWSWIIDPSCYVPISVKPDLFEEEELGGDLDKGACFVEYKTEQSQLSFKYLSGTRWYEINFRRKAINNTFAILGFGFADAYGIDGNFIPLNQAQFEHRAEGQSDWVAPMIFDVVSGGDNTSIYTYTGGSHGTDNAEGDPTSEMMSLDIYIDGAKISLDKDFSSYCTFVKVHTVNALQASNTIISKRFAAEEYLTFDISSSGIYVHKYFNPLEEIDMYVDNGLQGYLPGFSQNAANYLMFGTEQTARKDFDNQPFTSGPRADYPLAYGYSVRHSISGEFSSWIDISYGVGDRSHLPDNLPMIDKPREFGKIYPRLFEFSAPYRVTPSDGYSWRGGYYWGMPTTSGSFDTVLQTQSGVISVKPDGSYIIS